MGRVFALKNVRLFYKKSGTLRFVSHLDMNRFMTRIVRLSKVPVWYTEGFNKHPYITFALPLSLGFDSEYEVMDFRLDNDEFPLERAKEMIKAVCPSGMEIIDLREPVYKAGKIAFADFECRFATDSGTIEDTLKTFLAQKEIIVSKKTKKGGINQIDIAPKISFFDVREENQQIILSLRLPAGGQDNINPKILVNAYFESIGSKNPYCHITRRMLYLQDGKIFM